jgi:glycosyltransferase involved in cell wall biosynthesis
VEIVRYDERSRLSVKPLLDCDVVHVFRRSDSQIAKGIDTLRARGIGVTFDNDDDVRLAPKESDFFKRLGGAGLHRDYQMQVQVMRRAQIVTTTTATLAERLRADFDGPIEVIPNYLADQQFARGPRNSDGVVIGWVAGSEHIADARRLKITQVLENVMARRPDVRVVTMGVRLDLDASRYTHHKYIPIHELGAEVRKFDIGIAPLADIPMSYARSDVKVKEYGAVGVPWVASKRGPYASLSPRCGGLVVEDDGWEEALLSLASSKWKRGQLRRVAERWARSQRIDKHVGEWEAVWQAAADAAKRAVAA